MDNHWYNRITDNKTFRCYYTSTLCYKEKENMQTYISS